MRKVLDNGKLYAAFLRVRVDEGWNSWRAGEWAYARPPELLVTPRSVGAKRKNPRVERVYPNLCQQTSASGPASTDDALYRPSADIHTTRTAPRRSSNAVLIAWLIRINTPARAMRARANAAAAADAKYTKIDVLITRHASSEGLCIHSARNHCLITLIHKIHNTTTIKINF